MPRAALFRLPSPLLTQPVDAEVVHEAGVVVVGDKGDVRGATTHVRRRVRERRRLRTTGHGRRMMSGSDGLLNRHARGEPAALTSLGTAAVRLVADLPIHTWVWGGGEAGAVKTPHGLHPALS